MLSHPAVAAVNVASSDWTPSFVANLASSGLGDNGYAIPAGASQLKTAPWSNIDTIRIKFTEDVVVNAADLSVSGVNQTAYVFSAFGYDSNTYTATWVLTSPISKDKLAIDLDANGMAPVRSVATGEAFDGAWVDGQSTFPSGNTQGGTDFHFRLNVLPGDGSADNRVNGTDVCQVNLRYNKVIGDSQYDVRYDLDGDGVISATDYSFALSQVGALLPSGNPPGMTTDAPTTSGIPDLSIAKGAVDHVLTLTDFFADGQSPPQDMVFSIVQDSNPALFSSLTVNSGDLTLTFAENVTGDAILTIRATGSVGLMAETTLVTHVSTAPVITDFYCINDTGDYWTLTGVVTDADDPVAGDIIKFGGVLAGFNLTATVDENGVFSVTAELIGMQSGTGTAQTTDLHGVLSNLATDWIVV
ncbi:MAG: hypothetical protein ABFC96_14555 [Thermoguttaceae bacterium]